MESVVFPDTAGGINCNFRPGDFMLLSDRINLIGMNPPRELPVQEKRSPPFPASRITRRGCIEKSSVTKTYCKPARKCVQCGAHPAAICPVANRSCRRQAPKGRKNLRIDANPLVCGIKVEIV